MTTVLDFIKSNELLESYKRDLQELKNTLATALTVRLMSHQYSQEDLELYSHRELNMREFKELYPQVVGAIEAFTEDMGCCQCD